MRHEYDYQTGVLSTVGEVMHEQIEIRKQLAEDAILLAVLIELNRLGYTVIPPDGMQGEETNL